MGDTRKRPQADLGLPLAATRRMPPSKGVCVALSGGIDSVVLLHVLLPWARTRGIPLAAMHVHHGISPNADAWARFCRELCERLHVPFRAVRVDISPWRDQGIEAAARAARWQALGACGANHIALAHHKDDQAETVLLQLLRGSGVPGLAAMGFEAALPGPFKREHGGPIIVRPMLDVTRGEIEGYARHHGLAWIHDESNDDVAMTRNFLRREVMPRLTAAEPAAVANLARSARHLAQAAELLMELGRADIGRSPRASSLLLPPLLALGESRMQNALRAWLRDRNVMPPSTVQLEELIRQLRQARPAARVEFQCAQFALRRYRDRLYLMRPQPDAPATFEFEWNGRTRWALPPLGGVLTMRKRTGAGIADRWMRPGRISIRSRVAGGCIRLNAGGGHRSLKNVFQEAAVPPWERDRLPLIHVDGNLACIPGIGVDLTFRAAAGEVGWGATWHPDASGWESDPD